MLQDIRIRQRDYLIRMARVLSQELDMDALLWQIMQMSVGLVGGESGFIALYSKSNGWQLQTSMELSDPALKYIETYLDAISDLPDLSDNSPMVQINLLIKRMRNMQEMNIADGVGIPLESHDSMLGVIVVFRSYRVIFSLYEKSLMTAFIEQASVAVRNALLYNENLKEKNKLNAIIESAADGIIVMNVAHRIERINASLARLLKIKPEEISGKHHDEIIRFVNVSSGMELREGEAGGWPLSRDSRLSVEGDISVSNNDRTAPVSITYTPVMDDHDHILNIIAIVRDISKFREADDLKNTFISTISHELKTPVAIIKGYASTLNLDDADWDMEFIRDSLNVIEEEADHLTSMINDLLDASRLYSGSFKLNRDDLNLPDLCFHLAEHMQRQTTSNQIVCDFAEGFPIISADENRISQVITNLISNAMKYAPNGIITIRGTYDEREVEISVSDEGDGLSDLDIEHVFERFYRSKKTANSAKGTGLGLFLCDAIVKSHGGKIYAENRKDRSGAIFSFTIPLMQDSAPTELDFGHHLK